MLTQVVYLDKDRNIVISTVRPEKNSKYECHLSLKSDMSRKLNNDLSSRFSFCVLSTWLIPVPVF